MNNIKQTMDQLEHNRLVVSDRIRQLQVEITKQEGIYDLIVSQIMALNSVSEDNNEKVAEVMPLNTAAVSESLGQTTQHPE